MPLPQWWQRPGGTFRNIRGLREGRGSWWVRQKVLVPITELQEGCVGSGRRELKAEHRGNVTGLLLEGKLPISYKEIANCLDSVVRIESLVQARVTATTGKLPQKFQSEVPSVHAKPAESPWGNLGLMAPGTEVAVRQSQPQGL